MSVSLCANPDRLMASEKTGGNQTDRPALTSPVFLLGPHKSGSSMLRSLLDDHPDLFVLPTESHYFYCTGHWLDYPIRRCWPQHKDRESLIESLVAFIAEKNADQDRYGDALLTGRFDIQRFRDFLTTNVFETSSELFVVYIQAIHIALTGETLPERIRLVEKSVEHAECAMLLKRMYPDSRFIHIVRNPYASLVSTRKQMAQTKKCYPFLGGILGSLYNSYYNLDRNEQVLDDYLVIRYEDLVLSTQETMQQIADFIDIPFCDALLTPTLMGEPWGGNSTSNRAFSGISKAPLERFKSEITDIEIRMVNGWLQPVLDRFGYEQLESVKRRWWPVTGENLKTYIRNRSLLWREVW